MARWNEIPVEAAVTGSEPDGAEILARIARTLTAAHLDRDARALASAGIPRLRAEEAARDVVQGIGGSGAVSALSRAALAALHERARAESDATEDTEGPSDAILARAVLRAPSRPLDGTVRAALVRSGVAAPGSPRIAQGPALDRALAARGADALATGDRVVLPNGSAPEASLGLLAHELTHVAHARTSGPHGSGRVRREEREAESAERRVRAIFTPGEPPAPIPAFPGPINRLGKSSDAGPAERSDAPSTRPVVRLAATDRASDLPAPGPTASPDVGALKEEVLNALMDRLRTDAERGA